MDHKCALANHNLITKTRLRPYQLQEPGKTKTDRERRIFDTDTVPKQTGFEEPEHGEDPLGKTASEGDYIYVGELTKQGVTAQIDARFRASGPMRAKWDRIDYVERTISAVRRDQAKKHSLDSEPLWCVSAADFMDISFPEQRVLITTLLWFARFGSDIDRDCAGLAPREKSRAA
jgi:hypothetical protein